MFLTVECFDSSTQEVGRFTLPLSSDLKIVSS